MQETRAPVAGKKSAAFPSAKQHFKMAQGWSNDFSVMESRCNDYRYKG